MNITIYQLHSNDKDALGAVRCISGLMAAEKEDTVWLRDELNSAESVAALQRLPVRNTYYTDETGQLIPKGSLTPVSILQEMDWQPLTMFIPVKAPVAALPGLLQSKAMVQLKYSGKQRPGRGLLTTLDLWKQYAETAPAVRLELLSFAVQENGDVFITGELLPPLPGKEYWMTLDIYIPAGYDLDNGLMPLLLSQQLNTEGKSVMVFDREGNWQAIDKNYFVKGKRSAVRLTQC